MGEMEGELDWEGEGANDAEIADSERRLEGRIWMTKTGEEIPVSTMTDSHLLNTLRFLKRNGYIHESVLHSYLGPGPTADAASMAFQREQDTFFEGLCSGEIKPSPWVGILEEEAKKRGLEVCHG